MFTFGPTGGNRDHILCHGVGAFKMGRISSTRQVRDMKPEGQGAGGTASTSLTPSLSVCRTAVTRRLIKLQVES